MARVDRETELNGLDKHHTDMTNYPEFMGRSSIPAQGARKRKVTDGGKNKTTSDD